MDNNVMMGTNEACRYLGINLAMFRYYVWTKHYLSPDQKVGKNLAFTRANLDAFKVKHLSDGYTLNQAAHYLDVKVSLLRHHLYNTRLLVADSRRGKSAVFSRDTLDAFKTLLPPPEEAQRELVTA